MFMLAIKNKTAYALNKCLQHCHTLIHLGIHCLGVNLFADLSVPYSMFNLLWSCQITINRIFHVLYLHQTA